MIDDIDITQYNKKHKYGIYKVTGEQIDRLCRLIEELIRVLKNGKKPI